MRFLFIVCNSICYFRALSFNCRYYEPYPHIKENITSSVLKGAKKKDNMRSSMEESDVTEGN